MKIKNHIKKYKKTYIACTVLLIGLGWYYFSSTKSAAVSYTVRPASLGTIRSVVSGTGQVQSSQQVSISPKVSSTVTGVYVKNGDAVHAGDLLVALDTSTALFSLENAKISLEKLQSASPVSLGSAQNTFQNSSDTLNQSYDTAFNTLVTSYGDMNTILASLNDIFYTRDTSPYFSDSSSLNQNYGPNAYDYKMTAGKKLDAAAAAYANFRNTYITQTRTNTTTLAATLTQEYAVSQSVLEAVRSASVAINYIYNNTSKSSRTSAMNSDVNNLTSWTSTANKDVAAIVDAMNSVQNNTRSLTQADANLTNVSAGSNPLDIKSAELSLAQAQYSYDQYFIRAPFDGIIGNVSVHKADSVTGSTVIGTLVTKDYISKISLNEVDAAKVAVGQPVQITFNALPDLTVKGTVSDVDSVGTVSQGVVSYSITVAFNTDDAQVKAGMSINVDIVTAEKDQVITVPNGAIKTIGRKTYVQVPTSAITPLAQTTNVNTMGGAQASSTNQYRKNRGGTATSAENKEVTVGLSDDTSTEITSGINEGDLVVIKTSTGTAAAATTQGNIFSSIGGNRGGAGAARGATPGR
jgi:HlyD family secretion protein